MNALEALVCLYFDDCDLCGCDLHALDHGSICGFCLGLAVSVVDEESGEEVWTGSFGELLEMNPDEEIRELPARIGGGASPMFRIERANG